MTVTGATGLGAVAAALMFGGCGGTPQDMLAMKIELTALKQELEYLRQQTEDLDPRVSAAEQMAHQVIDERDAPFRLDCARQAPGVLPTRLAGLTVVCEDALAYPGGYRIRLKLGNPTSARLDGVRLTFYAGDGASRGRSHKRLYHEAPVTLRPGAWTSLEIDFAGLDEVSARDLAVRGDIATMTLARQ